MRDKRRLRLTERQTLLARVARREAMMALAGTLDDEAKSAALAGRSREMAREYGQRPVVGIAADLHQLSALSAGLARLAKDAEDARHDARQQAEWQVDVLARSETRLKRLEERKVAARRAVQSAAEKRAVSGQQPSTGGMARKLLNHTRTD